VVRRGGLAEPLSVRSNGSLKAETSATSAVSDNEEVLRSGTPKISCCLSQDVSVAPPLKFLPACKLQMSDTPTQICSHAKTAVY